MIRQTLEPYNPGGGPKIYDRPLTAENINDEGVYDLLEAVYSDAAKAYIVTYKNYLRATEEAYRDLYYQELRKQEIFFTYSPLLGFVSVPREQIISGLRRKARREYEADK